MKKILAMAAVAALAAGASAYAANPFSDVSTSDWAYQAISDLSDRGMVEGYPDGTFKGQQNITRFEVAQIIARLMAKEDQMNAEDRAIIDRLASEYGAELQNLGVRVSNLEKKVGNIAWSGDARIRYQRASMADENGNKDDFTGRIRINARATVNDSTYVHGRILGSADFKNGTDASIKMDRLYVHHQLGKVGATLGRYELDMGQQLGGWLYAEQFDGVELAAPLGEKVNLAIGYGRMKGANGIEPITVEKEKYAFNTFDKAEVFYAQAKANLGVAKLGVDYYTTSSFESLKYDNNAEKWKSEYGPSYKQSVWGLNLLVPINDFRVFGDYYADTKESKFFGQKGKIWTIGLGYGAKNLQKVGSFNLDLAYFKTKGGLYNGGTGLQVPTADALLWTNGHFWLASGDVVVAKNTYFHGEYAFSSKVDNRNHNTNLGANSWTLSLNYKF